MKKTRRKIDAAWKAINRKRCSGRSGSQSSGRSRTRVDPHPATRFPYLLQARAIGLGPLTSPAFQSAVAFST